MKTVIIVAQKGRFVIGNKTYHWTANGSGITEYAMTRKDAIRQVRLKLKMLYGEPIQ